MLNVDRLSMRFMGVVALENVSFSVRSGDIHAVIGPNGAGKTTLFNVIAGLYRPTSGTIRFNDDADITASPMHRRARVGIARTFQNLRLFGTMTALENTMLGASCKASDSILGAALGLPSSNRKEQQEIDRAYALLRRVGLAQQALTPARHLPYGAQRRLEIARALASDPRLLLLDEPVAGMNDDERDTLSGLIESIRDEGVTVLIVEHDLRFINRLSDRITVLNFGRIIADGAAHDVCRHPDVISAYLGAAHQRSVHA
ncbi:ABC transporter ATP-binding protein [Pandoraea anhela]|uniref:ABC transporter n=1 Tax=Pandoraea anhela TaxID=2508295 RepID=A0A5E4WDF4_9BURK|nr:ABC transporter ATP-binding protein [Pandoraea anhela]VVE23117.1 ABC transporter [Pandoraea anhela]